MTYYGVFIPCENEGEIKTLQQKYPTAVPIMYPSTNGEDG